MIVAVEQAGFLDATSYLRDANLVAAELHDRLFGDLAALGGMAGDDASATDFATAYDGAATEALAAVADLAAACASLGRLTERSWTHHEEAEGRSILPGRVIISQSCAPLPATGYVAVLSATPPTSLGGDPPTLTPHQAWVLDHIEAFMWPDADVDRLRTAAGRWRAAADSLDLLAAHVVRATAAWVTQRSPKPRSPPPLWATSGPRPRSSPHPSPPSAPTAMHTPTPSSRSARRSSRWCTRSCSWSSRAWSSEPSSAR